MKQRKNFIYQNMLDNVAKFDFFSGVMLQRIYLLYKRKMTFIYFYDLVYVFQSLQCVVFIINFYVY